MIVDFHTHIFPERVIQSRESFLDDGNFALLYSPEKSRMAGHETLLREMDAADVDRAVAMGFPWRKGEYCRMHNDYLLEAARKSDGRILPFASFPPLDAERVSQWMSQVKRDGFCGAGEVAFYSEGITESSMGRLKTLLTSAQGNGLPVCIHVNEPVGHRYAGKYDSGFMELCGAVSGSGDTTVILSHWGGGVLFYELMPEIKESFKNVYYDTAASPYLYENRIYDIAAGIVGSEKILFGTDFPLIGYPRYIDAIRDMDMSEEDKRNILGDNALRILRPGAR